MRHAGSLSISGEAARPLALGLAELRSLAEDELVADFHCREGWSRPGLRWLGVRLGRLLALAGATSAGRYVTVAAGDYAAVLSRDQAEDARVLVALERVEQAAARPGEFPRLVGPPDWDCFQSVKAVSTGSS